MRPESTLSLTVRRRRRWRRGRRGRRVRQIVLISFVGCSATRLRSWRFTGGPDATREKACIERSLHRRDAAEQRGAGEPQECRQLCRRSNRRGEQHCRKISARNLQRDCLFPASATLCSPQPAASASLAPSAAGKLHSLCPSRLVLHASRAGISPGTSTMLVPARASHLGAPAAALISPPNQASDQRRLRCDLARGTRCIPPAKPAKSCPEPRRALVCRALGASRTGPADMTCMQSAAARGPGAGGTMRTSPAATPHAVQYKAPARRRFVSFRFVAPVFPLPPSAHFSNSP